MLILPHCHWHTNFINYVAKSISIVILVGQFALYAFPAEQVAFEFSDVSDAIYVSYWYKNKVSNQKTLLYIMVAAQREQYLSGAGLVDINVDAFESVVRKSFSFCAVLRNLVNK
ncbi:7tm Odorant receptor [Popillia japonica]|uniref:7tm Odorant receptor n=1 Tax=Popillia japonica TaxID=7064 RepID=A0AAW1KMR9_POPJA